MQIKKLVTQEVTIGYLCDICKNSCCKIPDDSNSMEVANLSANWGFYSNKDLEQHYTDICENCYDRIWEFIETIGGKVEVL